MTHPRGMNAKGIIRTNFPIFFGHFGDGTIPEIKGLAGKTWKRRAVRTTTDHETNIRES